MRLRLLQMVRRFRQGREQSDGYALVLVLVAVALLSLMVATALTVSKSSVRSTSLDVTRAQLECTAEAGISEGMLTLVDQRSAMRWPIDGSPRTFTFGRFNVEVSIASEAGKVDLNNANRALIFGLFSAAGLDHTEADTFADRVLDWREPGTLKRLNGAKASDYRDAGLPYGPRDGPFQTIDELKLVLGMTPDLYAQLESGITVNSILPGPELQAAPPIVLRASGLDNATVEAIMAARAQGEVAPNPDNPGPGGIIRVPGLPGTAFTITATAQSDGVIVTRAETIRFTGNPNNPFWALAFKTAPS